MKYRLGIILLGVCQLLSACSGSQEELIDKRSGQNALSDLGSGNQNSDAIGTSPDSSTVVDEDILNFSGISFQLAPGHEALSPEFLDNIALVSMVAEDTIILFGKDGSSWHYGREADQPPTLILPLIAAPEGRQLLTMDSDDFWMIGGERVSKRKQDPELPANQVVLHNFDLSKLSGQLDKLRILGASHTSLILHMGTHIAIFSVIDGETAAYEFSSVLPGNIEGEVLAAGDTTDGGYWLATADRFALLRYADLKWHWKIASIPLNLDSFSSLAARIDVEGQRLSGDSLAVNGQIYSTSNAPIALPESE